MRTAPADKPGMGLFTLILMVISTPVSLAKPDSYAWKQRWTKLSELESILASVPDGRAVLAAAKAKDPKFLERVKIGSASFTESTFSRTYSLVDGKEQIALRHEITLNEGLSLADAVVDFAHELVHFNEKGMLDPYRSGFELGHFIRNGIEGDGGELAALAVECRVAWALEKKFTKFPRQRLCERYRKAENTFDASAARQDYYALGTWYRKASSSLKLTLPELNSKAAIFTSSYAGKPYPLALAEEFKMTQRAACANNRRKYRLIASTSMVERAPASEDLIRERDRLRDYDRMHCEPAGHSGSVAEEAADASG
jgi:hypothetical protein